MVLDLRGKPNWLGAVKEYDWQSASPQKLEPIQPDEKVAVHATGAMYTDKAGRPLSFDGRDAGPFMANLLNNAWKVWVIPGAERLVESGKALPEQIVRVLVRIGDKPLPRVDFNPAGDQLGKMELRPGTAKMAGEDIFIRDIIDVVSVEPPTLDGRPCKWVDLRFRGTQVCISFDLRPECLAKETWSDEEAEWYGDVMAQQLHAVTYGHLPILIPKLRHHGVPFTVGCGLDTMVKLCDAVDDGQGEPEIDVLLASSFNADDWRKTIVLWKRDGPWKGRGPVFDDILACYTIGAYGGAVVQLMAQAEGVIMDHLLPKGLGVKTNGWSLTWEKCVKQLQELAEENRLGPMRSIMLSGIAGFLTESRLYAGFTWLKDAPKMNRHAALHGKDTAYGTKANADRLFLLHDALYWVLKGKGPVTGTEPDGTA